LIIIFCENCAVLLYIQAYYSRKNLNELKRRIGIIETDFAKYRTKIATL